MGFKRAEPKMRRQEDIQPSAYSMVSLRSVAALLRPHPQLTRRQWNPSYLDIYDSNDGLHVYPLPTSFVIS